MKNKAIRFTAKWCGPCKRYEPIWKSVAETKDNWEFQVVDVDEDPSLPSEYKIMSIPTTIILRNGEEVGRKLGLLTKNELDNFLNFYE